MLIKNLCIFVWFPFQRSSQTIFFSMFNITKWSRYTLLCANNCWSQPFWRRYQIQYEEVRAPVFNALLWDVCTGRVNVCLNCFPNLFIYCRSASLTQKPRKGFTGARTTAGRQSPCSSPDQMESQRMMVRILCGGHAQCMTWTRVVCRCYCIWTGIPVWNNTIETVC